MTNKKACGGSLKRKGHHALHTHVGLLHGVVAALLSTVAIQSISVRSVCDSGTRSRRDRDLDSSMSHHTSVPHALIPFLLRSAVSQIRCVLSAFLEVTLQLPSLHVCESDVVAICRKE